MGINAVFAALIHAVSIFNRFPIGQGTVFQYALDDVSFISFHIQLGYFNIPKKVW